jgi:hypothetical protein
MYFILDSGLDYPLAGGSVSFWFKPDWTLDSGFAAGNPIFFKPVSDRPGVGTAGGPLVGIYLAEMGTISDRAVNGVLPAAALPMNAAAALWQDMGWNHLVGSWISPTTLSFTLNGAGDAHVDDDGGWRLPLVIPVYLRLSSPASPIEGCLDDVAVWDRALSFEEIVAMYAASAPIGDVCGL